MLNLYAGYVNIYSKSNCKVRDSHLSEDSRVLGC